jgi:hypothetical protein
LTQSSASLPEVTVSTIRKWTIKSADLKTNHSTITMNNNMLITVIFKPKDFNGPDNAIDTYEHLKLNGWTAVQIYEYALFLVNQPEDKLRWTLNQPEDKLRWTLNQSIIDLSKMKYPLDYKDGKFWMQTSFEGDMVETNCQMIDFINNKIIEIFVMKALYGFIEQQLATSE